VYQNGGRIFSEDGKNCLLNSPEALEAAQFLIALDLQHKVIPSISEIQDTSTQDLFLSQKLGMFFSGRYYVSDLQKMAGNTLKWGVAPAIHKEGRERVNTTPSPYGWVISSGTKNPEKVWELYEYLIIGEGEKMLAKAGYNIPILKSLAYSGLFLANPNHPKGVNKIFLDDVPYTLPSPVSLYIESSRFSTLVSDEMTKIKTGAISVDRGMEYLTKSVNDIINENSLKRNKN